MASNKKVNIRLSEFSLLSFHAVLWFCRLQKPNQFNPDVVLNQLRYSGMLETVKIRRAGFPVRRTFKDFYSRSAEQPRNPVRDESVCCPFGLNVLACVPTGTR